MSNMGEIDASIHSPQRARCGAPTPQIISKFYDFMMWFMDRTQRFPRNYRNTLTRWIEDQLWCTLELLIEAAYTRHKLSLLEQANLQLQKLRYLTRLINKIGMELGGWIKQQQTR